MNVKSKAIKLLIRLRWCNSATKRFYFQNSIFIKTSDKIICWKVLMGVVFPFL
jgi:hypothetical protein